MADPALMQQDMPLGFRFCPTDEELVGHYLRHKLMADDPSIHDTIPEIEVCKFEPWELPGLIIQNLHLLLLQTNICFSVALLFMLQSSYDALPFDLASSSSSYPTAVVPSSSLNKSGDPEWYFFSPRCYKYSNSNQYNRATSSGYWKVTGQDREIRDLATNNVIGTKQSLVFHQGRTKTNWIIHEYQYCDDFFPPNQGTYVLCKLRRKSGKKTKEKTDETREPNDGMAAEYGNQANDMIPGVQIPESGDFGGSPHEVGSSNEMLRDEPEDAFDVDSLLLSSPLEDDQD
ncbi:protein NTM1-like 9 isoform X1 [Neltuma alba]|uniref:protein NTM1-like 9 isoform X1 n=1 Tax=Neltuma alba TaxID=207710 RepID=UPI0010A3D953|nr:protein NTM1-like 9 isoform X1 [Prosopis alba]